MDRVGGIHFFQHDLEPRLSLLQSFVNTNKNLLKIPLHLPVEAEEEAPHEKEEVEEKEEEEEAEEEEEEEAEEEREAEEGEAATAPVATM